MTDFRCYPEVDLELAEGLTALIGENGQGKTNVLEAIGYLATLGSFRGAPTEALVRAGAERSVIRAEATRDDRRLLIEAELALAGRSRVQVNRQKLARAKDLLGAVRVSVFAPDDLTLVKGGPAERRRYLDDTLVALHPSHDRLRTDLDKILRQRNALLRQAPGRLTPEIEVTLDVWDRKLTETGTALGLARQELVDRLNPVLGDAYRQLARTDVEVSITYEASWLDMGLEAALSAARDNELRRGVSLVGPHRDDLKIMLGGLPARTHASQGEQRSLALALRLASHLLVTAVVGSAPVLLLDDVFSELDEGRASALLQSLPRGQILLTSASGLPRAAQPDEVIRVHDARLKTETTP